MQKIAYRALKTFLQAALAIVVASGMGYIDANVWQTAAIAGVAAVFAFAYNVVSDWEP